MMVKRLVQLFLGVVVDKVDTTSISDDTLYFDPHILNSWVVNLVDGFV